MPVTVIKLKENNPYEVKSVENHQSYVKTKQLFENRDTDMQIVLEKGNRALILKEYVAGLVEEVKEKVKEVVVETHTRKVSSE